MKLVLLIGMLVIFISCFFIFFTFDSMIRTKLVCTIGSTYECNVKELNMTIIIGILIVGMFLFIDTLVVYIMIKSWVPDLFIYSGH
ncbi:MAG: hypothetical protein J7K72_04600 [Candidatus Aenigmarchaeota archaeon]|nr:hypothetical protein [Candidatus Aenigmarchaeota archaeon]